MEIIPSITEIQKYINGPFLAVFVLLSYRLKGPLSETLKINKTYIVFIIATVVAIPFWVIFKCDKLQLFITYAVGTSFHELIIGAIIKKLKGNSGKQNEGN